MEPPLGQRLETVREKLQALRWIDGVHGSLGGQVRVELLYQDQALIDDPLALLGRELAGRGEEFLQGYCGSEVSVCCTLPRVPSRVHNGASHLPIVLLVMSCVPGAFVAIALRLALYPSSAQSYSLGRLCISISGPLRHAGTVIKNRKYVRHWLDSSLSRNCHPVDPRRKRTDLSLEPSV